MPPYTMKLQEISSDPLQESVLQALQHSYSGRKLKKSTELDTLAKRVSAAPPDVRVRVKSLLDAINKAIANKEYQQASLLKDKLSNQLQHI